MIRKLNLKNISYQSILLWGLIIWGFFKFVMPGIFGPIGTFFKSVSSLIFDKKTNDNIAADTSGTGSGAVNETNRAAVVRDVASQCQVAIHDFQKGIFGNTQERFTEDEAAVVAALNRLNNSTEARLCSTEYYAISHQWKKTNTLKADVLKYLDASDRSKIKSVVLTALA